MSNVARFLVCAVALLVCAESSAQKFVANYDEAKIPAFELPDVLTTESGETVSTAQQWPQRRAEILEMFKSQVYGRAPKPCECMIRATGDEVAVFGGIGIRRQVNMYIGGGSDNAAPVRMLIYTPKSDGPVPTFLTLNFQGNHTISDASDVAITESWVRDRKNETTDGNRALEGGRGVAANRWPVKTILQRGYGLVAIYYGDIDPDFDDQFQNGIHGQLADKMKDVPEAERWGSIAGWAYGLSRALDYLEHDRYVDAKRVAVFGHSRLGKTSLWAGASDPRFKMVISNDSGCGGAALSRRAIGETVGRINSSFPHWFCGNFKKYNTNENALPVDQHQLMALIAPRALYVASATDDQWADPKGEFLSAVHADPVYRLLGTDGLGGDAPPSEMPAADQPIDDGMIGYHLRTGKHDVTDFDWNQYLDFADRHL